MNRLKDKVAIITGGTHGIGRATVELFAKEGARVFFTGRDESAGRRLAKSIGRHHQRGEFIAQDVRIEQQWEELVKHVLLISGRIDVLVNNAGIYLIKPLKDTLLADMENLWRTNVAGTFLGMKCVAPIMARKGGGSIVNLSSMDGNVGSEGHVAYGGTKGAVAAMTRHAAIEYAGKKVRVNSVHPGYIRTEMANAGARYYKQSIKEMGEDFPLGHIGEPIDVAYGILYLACAESRFVTGIELVIDGGALAE